MTLRPVAFAIPGDIATPTGGYVYERRLLEELRAQGRDVAHLQLGGSFPDPTPADMADAVAQLMAVPPEHAILLDGFISATLDTAALARLPAPSVAIVHHPLALESGLSDARRDVLDRSERENLALIPRVIVPSPHTARILTERYAVAPERITVIQPGTDRSALAPAPVSPPLILSVGIQHPRKGHDILLQALARLRHRDWSAVIVGKAYDAAHAAALKEMRLALGLEDRVTLAGYVPGDGLARLYSQATVFALATRYEGYGIVFNEALCAGLPIVTCATGAVPDTVPPGAGRLVPVEDAAAFAEALDAVLTDDEARSRAVAAATQAARELPDWPGAARTAGTVLDGGLSKARN